MNFADWLKKKGGMTEFADSGLMSAADNISRLMEGAVDDAELPGGGDVAEPPARKPLVTQSAASVRSGDDDTERETVTAQGIDPETQAALNDPRASAQNQAARARLNDMSNVFRAAAGLPTAQMADTYVSERDKLRDWVTSRGQAQNRDTQTQLQRERTAAYLEATRAAKERDAAARAIRAEQEGNKAEATKAKAELERLKMEHDVERDKWKRDLEEKKFGLEEKKFAKKSAPKPGGPKLSPKGFPAGWELEGNTQPTPKQGEEFEKLVFSSGKMQGLTAQMRKMLAEAGSARVLPGPLKSRLAQLATEIQVEGKNIAELGALSGPDYALMGAIAADPTKLDSFAKDIPALLDGLEAWGENSVSAKAKSLGARKAGGATKAPQSGGTVTVRRRKDGATKTLTAEQAAKVLKSAEYEEVK